jgi:hypothetical protein
MNDKISDINMNVRDIARNVIGPTSFHPFRGQMNPTIRISSCEHPLIRKRKLHTDRNYNNIQIPLINHL